MKNVWIKSLFILGCLLLIVGNYLNFYILLTSHFLAFPYDPEFLSCLLLAAGSVMLAAVWLIVWREKRRRQTVQHALRASLILWIIGAITLISAAVCAVFRVSSTVLLTLLMGGGLFMFLASGAACLCDDLERTPHIAKMIAVAVFLLASAPLSIVLRAYYLFNGTVTTMFFDDPKWYAALAFCVLFLLPYIILHIVQRKRFNRKVFLYEIGLWLFSVEIRIYLFLLCFGLT